MSLKLVPAALLLFVAVAAGGITQLRSASADPVGAPVVGPTTITVGDSTGVFASWGPDENGATTLRATNDIGVFIAAYAPEGVNNLGEVTQLSTSEITIADDADGAAEPLTTVNAIFKCTSAGNTTFILNHQGVDSAESEVLTCEASAAGNENGGPDVTLLGLGQVVVTAKPNILPCEGGTTELTAEVVDEFGNVVPDLEFRFFTTAGTLVQTSPTTADLTLGPNQVSAEVSASIPDSIDEEIDVVTTSVALACNGSSENQTLVVTASPNVVDCTGTTTITASVRDVNGHAIPGRGFHFVTSSGLLTVDPNNANTEEGRATLTLRPGDGDATVVVTSGLLHGTYQDHDGIEDDYVDAENPGVEDGDIQTGLVTVQQNCLSTTTGLIDVTVSARNVTCGENVFIGLSVLDEDIQTVVDNTPLTLIASAGGFYGGEGTLLSAVQVPTSHGEANTIYTAPANFNGEVKITAASGDAYGYETLNVTCVIAPNTGAGTGAITSASPATGTGTSNATAPSCTPIGDGVCIPNRNSITPPSTGSAGLK